MLGGEDKRPSLMRIYRSNNIDVRNVGAPVTREMYYGALHGADWDGEDRGLDGRMSKLRRKLLAAGLPARRITTIRSVGYQLTTTG